MCRCKILVPLLALASALLAPLAVAAEEPLEPWYQRVEVGGVVFADAYGLVGHHDADLDGRTGFWLRRVRLTLDHEIAPEWSARLRFEATSPGDFRSDSKLDPSIKDAYLQWRRGPHQLQMGLAASPTWDFVEGFWGFRHVEKTPADLYRLGSSRELGLAYRGKVAGGKVFYHTTFGNGAGDGSETDHGKKLAMAVGYQPSRSFVIQLYADRDDRPASSDRSTWQAFAGWRGDSWRVGAQYVEQRRDLGSAVEAAIAVGSVFGVVDLGQRSSIALRVDRAFDPNPEADRIPYLVLTKDHELDLFLVAWQYRLNSAVSVSPSLTVVRYRAAASEPPPDDTVMTRVTLAYRF